MAIKITDDRQHFHSNETDGEEERRRGGEENKET
jgi:hypothetical protein